ncbi:ABC transporter ATP-binding protein [Polaromonas sp. A23]|nr:ABC transporter ATP-binding protein [Polaromonas sp. A23]
MHTIQPISRLLPRLWRHIPARRRGQFCLLLGLMIVASFAEILSIGAVLPFLGVLTSPARVFEYPLAQPMIRALNIRSADELLLPLTLAFGAAAVIAGAMRLALLWATTRLSFATGADLSSDIYRRTLYQPYAVHVARNSSEVINGISGKANGVIYTTIVPLLTLISSAVMLVAILVAMLSVNPVIALSAFGGFGLIYAVIIGLSRKRMLLDSQVQARESTQVIKSLQEGLGGIRDVLIDGTQAAYCAAYQSSDRPLRRAQGNSFFIQAAPRYGMEALGMLLIAALAFALAQQPGGVANAIPVLGALALGAQRLLPVLQQAYASWTNIQTGQASLQDAIELLDQPLPDHAGQPAAAPLPFQRSIVLNQLSFQYAPGAAWVLKDIGLTIEKGSRVGFIGATGSGKSTLLDVVMGLLEPAFGSIEVDGQKLTAANSRNWQAHIAHVPQAIFLADNSIEENIAFGQPKDQIDHERVRFAAQQAQIAGLIETWPRGYETSVGERGVRLSGGQRQRIGIARALYRRADVIIFDEATSALDNETELAVMQAIEGLSETLTILIIAHRLTTLRNCSLIVELGNGGITRTGTYQEIVNHTA